MNLIFWLGTILIWSFFFLKGFVEEEHILLYLFKGSTATKIPARQSKKNNPSKH